MENDFIPEQGNQPDYPESGDENDEDPIILEVNGIEWDDDDSPESPESEDSDDSDEPEPNPHRMLHINLIMRTIFVLIDINSLKTARLVCGNWCDLIEPIFRKKTQVVFKSPGSNPVYQMKTPQRFLDEFPLTRTINSGRYKFESAQYYLSHFFEIFRRDFCMLKCLTLERVSFFSDEQIPLNTFNLDGMLYRFNSLRELVITCPQSIPFPLKAGATLFTDQVATIFTISMEKLSALKLLHLENCAIFIPLYHNYDVKCTIKKTLHLKEVTFVQPCTLTNVASVLLNDYFNFSAVKSVHISQLFSDSKFRLDLTECFENTIDLVDITGVSVRTSVDFKLRNLISDVRLDIFTLPDSLESIHFNGIPEIYNYYVPHNTLPSDEDEQSPDRIPDQNSPVAPAPYFATTFYSQPGVWAGALREGVQQLSSSLAMPNNYGVTLSNQIFVVSNPRQQVLANLFQ